MRVWIPVLSFFTCISYSWSATTVAPKEFVGTIFVSDATIGIPIGLFSVASAIVLFCVVCHLCNRRSKKEDEEPLEKEPASTKSSATVFPQINPALFTKIPDKKPEYTP